MGYPQGVANELSDPTRQDVAGERFEPAADAPPVIPASSDPIRGVLAGRYRVMALLGAGGMGSVYLAHDAVLGEKVALKMLRVDRSGDEFIERLRSEVRLARRVTHPHVARVYDIGEHEGEHFLTMEYVDGSSLGARIMRDGPLDSRSFFRVARDLADGLIAAHAAGVIHRDLKPANILIDQDDRAVITDFGTARSPDAEPENLVIGTPSFMAPEQFQAVFDRRTDVFGFGAVLYCMLTASRPFVGPPHQRPDRAPNPRDVRPGLSVALGRVIARCLEPLPEDRFPDVERLTAALAAAATAHDDKPPADVVTGSVAARILRAVQVQPRNLLVRAGADGENDAFANGLRDELLGQLNGHGALRAVSDEGSPHEATARLTVTRDGLDALVLDVRVVGAREGFEFWRGSFQGTADDAIGLARAAAFGIEGALALAVPTGAALEPLGREASALYLAGRAAHRELWPDALRRASEAFEQALVLSPDHPLLLAALATSRARQCFFDQGSVESGRRAAERAVRLAPHRAEAHAARAAIVLQDADVEEAVTSLMRALELEPGHEQALRVLGDLLLELGAATDSIRLGEALLARAPENDHPLMQVARAHALLGHWDLSTAAIDRIHTEGTRPLALGLGCRIAMWRRDVRPVQATLDALRAMGADPLAIAYRLTYLMCEAVLDGRPHRANMAHQQGRFGSSATRRRRGFVLQLEAELDAYMGDFGEALATIDAAVGEGLFDVFWLDRCPLFDELRGSVRFESARREVQERARRGLGRLQRAC